MKQDPTNENSYDTSKSKAYRELRRSIIIGRRRLGERLSLDGLAKTCNTSIIPLRDAPHMLAQERLVTVWSLRAR